MFAQAAALGVAGAGGALPHFDKIQSSFGRHDLSQVQAHVGGAASDAARALNARAFAFGEDVAFSGAPSLHQAAHEAAHVIQQRGRVELDDGVDTVGDAYEQHADAVAQRVVAGESAEMLLDSGPAGRPGNQQQAPVVQRDGMGDVRAAEGGRRPMAPGEPVGTSEVAGFLRRLDPEMIRQTPNPLIIEKGAKGEIWFWLDARGIGGAGLPAGAHVSVWCKLIDGRGKPVSEIGANVLPGLGGVSPQRLDVPGPSTYHLELHFNDRDAGRRVLIKQLAIRAPDLNAARQLTDEQVEADADALDRRLADNKDPAERQTLLKARNELEWLQDERGTRPKTTTPSEEDLNTLDLSLPKDPVAMRRFLEPIVAEKGARGAREMINAARTNVYYTSFGNPEALAAYDRALQQIDLFEADEPAFRAEFRAAARKAADDILDQSEQEIANGLSSYGLMVDRKVLNIAASLQIKDDDLLGTAVEMVMQLSKTDTKPHPKQKDKFSGAQTDRSDLIAAAHQLKGLQRHVDGLKRQRDTLSAAHPPPPAGVDHPERVDVDRELARLDAEIPTAQQELQTRWLNAEQDHPILASYRNPNGDSPDLGALGDAQDEDGAMRAVLQNVLPKVKNIWLTRIELGHKVDPLELPPVVELTKQRLHVPENSVRARLVDEEVDKVTGTDWKDWAIMAVSLGLVVISAFATAGSSLAIGAELAGLALDVYMANEAIDDYSKNKALANTSLDRARSLAQSEPSLAWLAVQLVGVGVGAGAAMRTFREATTLRRAVIAGEKLDSPGIKAAVRALDDSGADMGVGNIGQKVAREAEAETDDVARAGAKAGRNVAKHPLYGDVVGELAASNTEALGRRLGAKVELDDDLGNGVEVLFHVDDAEQVSILSIKAGPLATTADVLAHGKTLKLLQRYNGTWGAIRRRIDDLLAFFKGGVARPGSEAWKARMEVEKIRRIVASRRAALARVVGADAEDLINAEIAFLEDQAATFDAIAAEARGNTAIAGAHSVGMPSTTKIHAAASQMAYDTSASFAQGARGIPKSPRGVHPPPMPAKLKHVVDEATGLSGITPVAEANKWMTKARAGDPASLRTEMAKAAREQAEAAVTKLRASSDFKALAAKDAATAERVATHTHHRAAQEYFHRIEEGAAAIAKRAEVKAGRGVVEAGDEYAAAETILDATGVKPVRGNLPANHEFAGGYVPRSYFKDYPKAQKLLDEKGMKGLPMSPSGQLDFTKWTYNKPGIKGDVEIPKLTGKYADDFAAADAKAGFTASNPRPRGWTWHHHDGTRMVLVPTDLHEAITHLGPAAHYRGISGVEDAYR